MNSHFKLPAECPATVFKDMPIEQAIDVIGELCRIDMRSSKILASVTAAQFIMESGFGKSELAQNANNCFGMKCHLSGNTWAGSTWDGTSYYVKNSCEECTPGTRTVFSSAFRKYPSVQHSVSDHSAYLLGAMRGSQKRFLGISKCRDPRMAIQILKDGGYATSSEYSDELFSVIEQFNLTKYDRKSPICIHKFLHLF